MVPVDDPATTLLPSGEKATLRIPKVAVLSVHEDIVRSTAESQTRMLASADAETSLVESLEYSREVTRLPCACSFSPTKASEEASHKRMLPRSSPDAMMDPPGDQTTDVILRLCASGRVIRGRKDDASQRIML